MDSWSSQLHSGTTHSSIKVVTTLDNSGIGTKECIEPAKQSKAVLLTDSPNKTEKTTWALSSWEGPPPRPTQRRRATRLRRCGRCARHKWRTNELCNWWTLPCYLHAMQYYNVEQRHTWADDHHQLDGKRSCRNTALPHIWVQCSGQGQSVMAKTMCSFIIIFDSVYLGTRSD